MNPITSPSNHVPSSIFREASGERPGPQSTPLAGDGFSRQSYAPIELMPNPKFDSQPPDPKGGFSLAKGLLLGAAVAGVGVGLVATAPADTIQQAEPSASQILAMRSADFLDQAGGQHGGGVKVRLHPFAPIDVDVEGSREQAAEQVIARLDQGETVKYYRHGNDERPIEIRSYRQLHEVAGEVFKDRLGDELIRGFGDLLNELNSF